MQCAVPPLSACTMASQPVTHPHFATGQLAARHARQDTCGAKVSCLTCAAMDWYAHGHHKRAPVHAHATQLEQLARCGPGCMAGLGDVTPCCPTAAAPHGLGPERHAQAASRAARMPPGWNTIRKLAPGQRAALVCAEHSPCSRIKRASVRIMHNW